MINLSGIRSHFNKRIVIIVAIVAAAIIGAVVYWVSYNNTKSNKLPSEISETIKMMERARMSDAEANKINTFNLAIDEVRGLNNAQKYTGAKTKLDKLSQNYGKDSNEQKSIQSAYITTCLGLLDDECLNSTLEYHRYNDTVYFVVGMQIAEKLTALQKNALAKKYYRLVLVFVEKNGGQAFIDKINLADKERQYDYSQIKKGAS